MSQVASQQIKLMLLGLAEYYRTTLTPNQLSMYTEDLVDLGVEAVGEAVRRIRKQSEQKFFPMPSEIREYAVGSLQEIAVEISGRIVQALAAHGNNNPEKARAFLGDIGWEVVKREGGWTALCKKVTDAELPTLKAQWRESTKVVVKRADRGELNKIPELPKSRNEPKKNDNDMMQISEIIRLETSKSGTGG